MLILTKKNLKVRYKEAMLGILWAIFVPLVTMVIFAFVFSRFARFDAGNIPYPIFVFCGILPWTFLSASLTGSIDILIKNSSLITKAYFPKEILPLSTILSNLVDFIIGIAVFFILALFYKLRFSMPIFWLVPAILLQILLLSGLSLILSVANLYYRDVQYIFQVLLVLWMFLTPIFYPITLLMKHKWIIWMNPVTPIVSLYRYALTGMPLPSSDIIVIGIAFSIVIFISGFYLFNKVEKQFAKYL